MISERFPSIRPLGEPFAAASTRFARSTNGENTHVRGSTTSEIVGAEGLEPPTPCL